MDIPDKSRTDLARHLMRQVRSTAREAPQSACCMALTCGSESTALTIPDGELEDIMYCILVAAYRCREQLKAEGREADLEAFDANFPSLMSRSCRGAQVRNMVSGLAKEFKDDPGIKALVR